MATRSVLRRVVSLLGKPPPQQDAAVDDQGAGAVVGTTGGGGARRATSLQPVKVIPGSKGDGEATEFFFARVPPSVTYDELLAVLAAYGPVEHLNLFRPFAEAKTSKGCGIVRFQSSAAAAAAKAALHDKYKWASDYAPMVLERVNEKKKRSNISSGGTNELIFTPKFLNSKKGNNTHEGPHTTQQQQQQQQGLSGNVGSCSSLLAPDLQRHLSQSSAYSVCSSYSTDGIPRYSSCGSLGTGSIAANSSRDSTVVSERGCGITPNGFLAPPSLEAVVSSGCNAIHSGSLLQASAAAGAAGRQPDGRPGMLANGQHMAAADRQRASFERTQQQHQQRLQQELLHQQQQRLQQEMQHQQQCMQQEMQQHFDLLTLYYNQQQQQHHHQPLAGRHVPAPAADEGCAGGAYLPAFRPLQAGGHPAPAALPAAAACSAAQPTSLSIMGGTPQQQQQLGMQLPFTGRGGFNCGMPTPAAAPPSCLPFIGAGNNMMPGSFTNPTAFDGLTMVPSVAGFSNECFSTYSNFINGHPSAQHAHARLSAGCNLAGPSTASLAEAAAAADCSASLLASGASLAPLQQQQHALMPQHQLLQPQHVGQSGSNLQLTTGALHKVVGGGWDNVEDNINSLQQQNVLQLEDSGYFDLMCRSTGSSVESLKGDATTGGSISSCPNKMSSCSSSTDTRANGGVSSAAMALARQQQDQLLSMQDQCQLQFSGLPSSSQMGQLRGPQPGGAFYARPTGTNSLACADTQWPLQDNQRLFSGADMPHGSTRACDSGGADGAAAASTAAGKGDDDGFVTVELPASAQAVGAVAPHINSITDMTGAAVLITSSGQLSFKLIGSAEQVAMATSVIQLLLQKQQQQQQSQG